eukprot:jgi/Botrbrau1/4728/Bobra.0218s0040.1
MILSFMKRWFISLLLCGVWEANARQLLQDATSAGADQTCGFKFGASTKTFSRCQNLADTLNADYTIFYDFLPSKADQLLGRLDVALDGPTKGNQYIAFGIPVTPDTMTGASAMVIKTNSSADSGASGEQYLLGGYAVAQVKPGGVLKVRNLKVGESKDRLQASFTLDDVPVSEGVIQTIAAVGALGANGALRQHTRASGAALVLPALPAATAAEAPTGTRPPGAAASAIPADGVRAPAPAAASGAPKAKAAAVAPSAVRGPAFASKSRPRAPAPEVERAPQGSLAPERAPLIRPVSLPGVQNTEDAPPPTGNVITHTTSAGSCLLGSPPGSDPADLLSFPGCSQLAGTSAGLRLLWKLNEEPPVAAGGGRRLRADGGAGSQMEKGAGAGKKSNVTLGFDAVLSQGWAAIGVPAVPGQMVGASAVFFHLCPSCPSGADWEQAHLASKRVSGVERPGKLSLDNVQAWQEGERVKGLFNILLDPDQISHQPFIYASGPMAPNGLQYAFHKFGEGSVFVDLRSDEVTFIDNEAHEREVLAHGFLMAMSWGVLIPVGAVVARNFKTLSSVWFNVHRIIQGIGWLLGWAGFGIGLHLTHGRYSLHQRLGIVIQLLGTFQVIFGVFARPLASSRVRRAWNLSHYGLGWLAIFLGIANIYIGLVNEAQAEPKYVAAYSVVLGAIALTSLCKGSYDYLTLPPPACELEASSRHPNHLSTNPVTAPKPFANLPTCKLPSLSRRKAQGVSKEVDLPETVKANPSDFSSGSKDLSDLHD